MSIRSLKSLSYNISKLYENLHADAKDDVKVLRIQVLGASTVGKTAMTLQYMHHRFIEEYEPTCIEAYNKLVVIADNTYNLSINDAGTGFCEDVLRDIHIKNSDCFVVMYSLISRGTFDEVNEILDKIQLIKLRKVPVIIVGNKSDLEEDRKVEEKEGKAMADSYGCDFYEISAKYDTLIISEIFEKLITLYQQFSFIKVKRERSLTTGSASTETGTGAGRESREDKQCSIQ